MNITSILQTSVFSVYAQTEADSGSNGTGRNNATSAGDTLILSLVEQKQTVYSSVTGSQQSSAEDSTLEAVPVSRLGQNSRNTYLELIRERVSFLLREISGGENTSGTAALQTNHDSGILDTSYSAEETANRIVNFALSFYNGEDPEEYANMVTDAVMKGYDQAREALGGSLPSIADETISLVMDKLQRFASGVSS